MSVKQISVLLCVRIYNVFSIYLPLLAKSIMSRFELIFRYHVAIIYVDRQLINVDIQRHKVDIQHNYLLTLHNWHGDEYLIILHVNFFSRMLIIMRI